MTEKTDHVLPDWAKEMLVGLSVESVSETYPHTLTLRFSNGTTLHVTGMPFRDGALDASVIEGPDAFINSPTKTP